MSNTVRPAPQLLFDDGSRAIQEDLPQLLDEHVKVGIPARDPAVPIREYYEIDRLCQEIRLLRRQAQNNRRSSTTVAGEEATADSSSWKNRIALQFPDELLVDAPDVAWEFEKSLAENNIDTDDELDDGDDGNNNNHDALVFILGDTTYQSCCPDVVAAAHLNADCIIHYGHACLLSVPATLPVLYSFGKQGADIDKAVQAVAAELPGQKVSTTKSDKKNNLLLLYEVKYAHAMDDLQKALQPYFDSVIVGRIPTSHGAALAADPTTKTTTCCQQAKTECACSSSSLPLHNDATTSTDTESTIAGDASHTKESPENNSKADTLVLGGLEIPPCDDWSQTTLLFVGQDEASRPLQNIMLRFLSMNPNEAPTAYWTWNPVSETLATQACNTLSRLLQRRFFLIQKCKLARVFGILVANPSDAATRPVVNHLQTLLRSGSNDATAVYTFMVGKVNPAKLANFPEVDAYILVACPEHALLEHERSDYMTPILTPLEVAMAVGGLEWGSLPYSLEARDFLQETRVAVKEAKGGGDDQEGYDEDDDDDAPYFNPVTGRYESALTRQDNEINLQALPGQGQLIAHESAAAMFLRQRQYQGLSVNAGETEVQAAVPGQQGIASNYGER